MEPGGEHALEQEEEEAEEEEEVGVEALAVLLVPARGHERVPEGEEADEADRTDLVPNAIIKYVNKKTLGI